MKKYIIYWDAGYGKEHDVVEVETEDGAHTAAYEQWYEDAQNNADYGVEGEATEELLEEYELE